VQAEKAAGRVPGPSWLPDMTGCCCDLLLSRTQQK
jgi:hypothetical protein